MKPRTVWMTGPLLLATLSSCGTTLSIPTTLYNPGPATLDIRPGESDAAFGDAFVTFDTQRWPDIRADWWNPLVHLALQQRAVELLLTTQPVTVAGPVSPQDYYATIPGLFQLIPWQDRIHIEVSLHLFDDALRGNDQREMRFSPYWIYRGFFAGAG